MFVDDYNVGSDAFRSVLWSSLANNPSPDLLICSNGEVPREMKEPLVVQLGGLTRTEFFELIQRRVRFSGTDEAQAQKLFELVAGEPLYADLAGKTIREHLFTLHEFVNGLRSFARSGIVGPDGEPLPRIPKPFKLVTVDTNQILRERLRANPGGLYSLEPRQFEELIADLLRERGYEITLTPPSKDGGFDMFAARRDDLGSFLYLVECKRFTPPHRVGVSIVRSLHGVVQQKQANAGIIVTSSFFTRGAKAFEESVPYQLQLRDYLALQKWLGVI
ncbi:MAG TPA: restriction endonuclease [Thermoanaerobaculia bacterium]|nr:restriction endonuclease [Thermoanaerobaculia bacterium]